MTTPNEAAALVLQAAYKKHPILADTYDTFSDARQAALDHGASLVDADYIVIAEWDKLSATSKTR